MPKLSCFFVKSALLCLVLGGALAGLALSGAGGLPPVLLALRPLAWHLLTVGWATQLIFGVAFWMFPHMPGGPPRGDEWPAWLVFWMLNSGLALRAVGEPLAGLRPGPVTAGLLPLAATLQLAAVLIFVLLTWPQVRSLAGRHTAG
ncbi:MAG: hypothetical protein ACUVR4_13280 [Anaerolineae bacterium]